MELCQNKRGNYVSMEYLDSTRVNIHYEIPLSEIVYDFSHQRWVETNRNDSERH